MTTQQKHLKAIRRSYVATSRKANGVKEKEQVEAIYQQHLERFLRDTCRYMLDSINVNVTTIHKKDSTISVGFDDRWFIYYTYASKSEGLQDTLYRFYHSLKEGDKVSLRLLYLGESDIKGEGTISFPKIRVAALPAGGALYAEDRHRLE